MDSSPHSESALLARARAQSGRTLRQVADVLGMPIALETKHAKGIAGQLVERLLGAEAGSRAVPDFEKLGIELKTLPIGEGGRPAESTFVATLNIEEPGALRWQGSSVRSKLRRVLWVPVEGNTGLAWAERRLGRPFLWSPTAAEESILREDFELLTELVAEGFADKVDARLGRALQLRPKGRNRGDLRWTLDGEGARVRAPGHGFYLRSRFTGAILEREMRP